MTNSIFPQGTTIANINKITELATRVFNTTVDTLTKQQIMYLIQLDMATNITELNVSVAITRPTEVKFATNNYHTSSKIDLSAVSKLNVSILEEIDKSELINKYLELKSVLFNYISIKYESMESYLRSLVESCAAKDSCPKTGRTNE